MRQTWVFAAFAFGLVALVLLATLPLLSADSWTWLAVAGGAALATQLVLRLSLTAWRRDARRFMRAIAAGAIGRLVIVAAAIVLVAVWEHPHPVVFLIGLAGFLFGLLMLEGLLENSKRFRTSEPLRPMNAETSADAGEDATEPAPSLAHG